jgi:hypothetical protein
MQNDGIYFEYFGGRESVESNFEVKLGDDIEILFAIYNCPPYEGDAFVLFRQGGTLYEVNGSHCSCYGLEGQWTPEETTVKSLRHIMDKGYKFVFRDVPEAESAFTDLLGRLESEEATANGDYEI